MLGNTLTVVSGKGGVGKTTLAAHLAALAAAGGWQTLVVDCDPQGNLMRDLGYASDGGAHLADALLGNVRLAPTADRRNNLHVVPGGPVMDEAIERLRARMHTDVGNTVFAFQDMLEPVAADYDLIVIDSPPREMLLRQLLLVASHYVVVPTLIDQGSIDGLPNVVASIKEARSRLNPDLELLGVAIGYPELQATVMRAETRGRLVGMLDGDESLVFTTMIRDADKVARDCRALGIISAEYAREAAKALPWYKTLGTEAKRFSRAADAVARDWRDLVDEILAAFQRRQTELAA